MFVHCEILLLKQNTNANVTYSMKSGILRHFQNGNKSKSLQYKVAFYSSSKVCFVKYDGYNHHLGIATSSTKDICDLAKNIW